MKFKKTLTALLAVLLLLCFVGCSSELSSEISYSKGESRYEMSNGITYGAVMDSTMAAGEAEAPKTQNQKLVRTMYIQSQTQDMDPLLSQIESKTPQLGGYMESKKIHNGVSTANRTTRPADLVIRVPADVADEFVEHISGQSNVVSLNETVDDITLTYVAVESRVTALETEQQRLLELLEKADSMSDLLQIEARLTEVRTELERMVSQMRVYDNMVDYATIQLSVTEVKEYTEPEVEKTVWQRIGDGLAASWNALATFCVELFVFLISSLPLLIPLTAIVVGVVIFLRKRKKKKLQDTETVAPPQEPEF